MQGQTTTLRGIMTFFGMSTDAGQQAAVNAGIEGTKTRLVATAQAAEGMRMSISSAFGSLQSLIAGYVGSKLLGSVTTAFAADASAIGKQAEAIGMSTDAYQVWTLAAKQAGVEADMFGGLVGKLGKKAHEAAAGQGEAAKAFTMLGMTASELKGLGTEQVLSRVSDAFQRMPAGPAKSAAAMKLFEEQGIKLLPFLSKGSAGIDELKRRMVESGAMISGTSIAMARRFSDAKKGLSVALLGIRNSIGAYLIEPLAKAMQAITKFMSKPKQLANILSLLRVAAIGVGLYLAKLIFPAVLAFFRSLATAAGLTWLALFAGILIIDDLYAFMEGRPSLVADLLGPEAQETLRSFLKGVGTFFGKVKSIGNWLVDLPERITEAWADLDNWLDKDLDVDSWPSALLWTMQQILRLFREIKNMFYGEDIKRELEYLKGGMKNAKAVDVSQEEVARRAVAAYSHGSAILEANLGASPRRMANTLGRGDEYEGTITPRQLSSAELIAATQAQMGAAMAQLQAMQIAPNVVVTVNAETTSSAEQIALVATAEIRRTLDETIRNARRNYK